MEANKKPKVEAASILKSLKFGNPVDKDGRKMYPTLYDLLCPRWQDGVLVRQAGRLTIKADGAAYRVSIECPTEGLQTSVVVDNLPNLLADTEKLVSQGQCHWALTWARQKKNLPTIEALLE
jgi:hypothetical protein